MTEFTEKEAGEDDQEQKRRLTEEEEKNSGDYQDNANVSKETGMSVSETDGTIFLFNDSGHVVTERRGWWDTVKSKCCCLRACGSKVSAREKKRNALVQKNGNYRPRLAKGRK